MHSLIKNNDDDYQVWFGSNDDAIMLFHKLSLGSAMMIVNALNGGAPIDPSMYKTFEYCFYKQ